jgi:phosphoglucosamine mutase
MEFLGEFVRNHGLMAGVALDGDADRCLCVDERGDLVDGDMIMAMCALDMKRRGKLSGNALVGTVLSNLGLQKFCAENGIHFTATKVGDRYVSEQMILQNANFGGEQSGHVIFRDYAVSGDGQLTAVQVLSLLARERAAMSELAACMVKYPQYMVNVTVSAHGKTEFYKNHAIKQAIEDTNRRIGADGRIVVRVSGTEPYVRVMAEHENDETAANTVEELAELIKKELS